MHSSTASILLLDSLDWQIPINHVDALQRLLRLIGAKLLKRNPAHYGSWCVLKIKLRLHFECLEFGFGTDKFHKAEPEPGC
jgi:hypothetical protein